MRGIEITFPVDVEVTDGFYQKLDALLGEVCKQYEKAHPGRVMWVFGQGHKMTFMPMTRQEEEERGIEFDDSIYAIEIAEREDYSSRESDNA